MAINMSTIVNYKGKKLNMVEFAEKFGIDVEDPEMIISTVALLVKRGSITVVDSSSKEEKILIDNSRIDMNSIPRKYELTNECIKFDGRKLYRIRALRDFSDVKANDLGGYIEKEENLDHRSNAWIYGKRCADAYVYGNARVYGNAKICNYAKVYENAKVYGDACVWGGNEVYGNAQVYENAQVYTTAQVYGNAKVHGNAKIAGDSQVYGNADIFGDGELRDGKYTSNIKLNSHQYKNNRSYQYDEERYDAIEYMKDNGYDPENDSFDDM